MSRPGELDSLQHAAANAAPRRVIRALPPFAVGVVVGAAVVVLFGSITPSPRDEPPRAPLVNPLTASPSAFDWTALPQASFPIPPYASGLRGVRIVLDPGHVGARDRGGTWKRGPTGLREAAVNLEVANFLREFLLAAGAEVILTRDSDVDQGLDDPEDLRSRAEVANRVVADLLVSIHHNAGPPTANHSVVFYHKSADHSPASLSAGRYLITGLNDALRLEEHARCALRSDYTIYPRDGFAVLRHATVPAVLVESSFFTHPDEEQRLRDRLYNRREAYGLFLGLARWAQAGLPRVRLLEPEDGVVRPRKAVTIALDDGLGGRAQGAPPNIRAESVLVKVDGKVIRPALELASGRLRFTPDAALLRAGKPFWVYVDFQNVFGQHTLHPWIELRPGP